MRNGNAPLGAVQRDGPKRDDPSVTPPAHTRQAERDEREKRKHEASESELPSTQEKNPIPPGTTRQTS